MRLVQPALFAPILCVLSLSVTLSAQTTPAPNPAAADKKTIEAAPKNEIKPADATTPDTAAKKTDPAAKPAAGDAKKTTDKKTDPKAAPAKDSAEEKKKKMEEFEHQADLKKAEWIEKTMDFGIQKDRRSALNFLPTVKDPGKKKDLQKKLIDLLDTDTDISLLVKALNIISELQAAEAIPAVKKHLSNESEDVRVAAVYALKDIKAVEMKGDLIEKLKAQDFAKESNFSEALLQTLADFKAIEIQDFAIEKIKDNKTAKNLRLSMVLFLGRSGAVGSKEYLEKTFSDPDEEMDLRAYCVNAVAKLGVKESLPAINKVVEEINAYPYAKKREYNSLYIYCISALVRLGDQNAYPRLVESLKSDNATTRVRAIKLLKDLGDKRSIDILKYKTQYDPSAAVQKEAREALKAMGEKVEDDPAEKKKVKPEPADPKNPKKDKADDAAQDDVKQNKREDF
jgi:HEAT repeat protein